MAIVIGLFAIGFILVASATQSFINYLKKKGKWIK